MRRGLDVAREVRERDKTMHGANKRMAGTEPKPSGMERRPIDNSQANAKPTLTLPPYRVRLRADCSARGWPVTCLV